MTILGKILIEQFFQGISGWSVVLNLLNIMTISNHPRPVGYTSSIFCGTFSFYKSLIYIYDSMNVGKTVADPWFTRDANTRKGTITYYFAKIVAKNCMKLKEFRPRLVRIPDAPLRSATGKVANLKNMVSVHCTALLEHGTIIRTFCFDTDFASQIKLIKLPLIHCFVSRRKCEPTTIKRAASETLCSSLVL